MGTRAPSLALPKIALIQRAAVIPSPVDVRQPPSALTSRPRAYRLPRCGSASIAASRTGWVEHLAGLVETNIRVSVRPMYSQRPAAMPPTVKAAGSAAHPRGLRRPLSMFWRAVQRSSADADGVLFRSRSSQQRFEVPGERNLDVVELPLP